MIVFKFQIKKLLEEAEKRGYEKGCLDGYKNCEKNMAETIRKAKEAAFEQGQNYQNPFKKR